ncbi:MAG: TATA-box-binding protein [Candidatus Hermodarchaeota archaeon]
MNTDLALEDRGRSLTYTIQNIVAKTSLNLGKIIDLNKVSEELQNTEYNSERFPGLFIRENHPKCVIILFKNGKMILTGLKSFDHVKIALNRSILKLNEILASNISPNSIHPKIVNIVLTANFYNRINLDRVLLKLPDTIYEPEVFPGLIYRANSPVKSVFLIFSTGKVVCTGIHKKKDIEPALMNLGRMFNEEKFFMPS